MTAPLIPESAPFSSEQRAWLNGFFAGMFSLGGNGNGAPTNGAVLPAGVAAMATAAPPAPPAAEEAFPWHDPAMPLDERLKLAEGKPIKRRLMAAMAQLDCGACGYLCKTYSEAIASGAEPDLTRCTPGGSDTAKALKKIFAERGSEPAEPPVGQKWPCRRSDRIDCARCRAIRQPKPSGSVQSRVADRRSRKSLPGPPARMRSLDASRFAQGHATRRHRLARLGPHL